MNTPPNIKLALQQLSESIKPVITTIGGTQLVETKTTQTATQPAPTPTAPK